MRLAGLSSTSSAALAHNRTRWCLLAAVGGTALCVVAAAAAYRHLSARARKGRVPVGVVSQLLIHPLKSGRAVSVGRAECLHMGLKHGELRDRQQPRLVLVSLTHGGGGGGGGGQLCLSAPDMEPLHMPLEQPGNAVIDCRVFSNPIQGRDCGDEAARWLRLYLGGEQNFRLRVVYPDVGPVMLLSAASVGDLNSKLDQDVTVERFRPNIVVSDCNAFEEDSWEELQIGDVRLQRVMACGRCVFTTVDPETGIISRKEPLDTLKGYRQCKPSDREIYKKSPLFGQFFTVKKMGIFQVGDVVYKIGR
ncbi:hypothetical protein CRUP_023716 [Coryphaenoides rupestris]|nr:hypothetical protein CRUP_023716 [Coryphaenoides rupestris]